MDDQLPKHIVQERYERLVALQERVTAEENALQVGRSVEVLVASGEGRKDDATRRLSGRAEDSRLVHFTVPAGPRSRARATWSPSTSPVPHRTSCSPTTTRRCASDAPGRRRLGPRAGRELRRAHARCRHGRRAPSVSLGCPRSVSGAELPGLRRRAPRCAHR